MADNFDPKEFEAFKTQSNPASVSSGNFDSEEFNNFKNSDQGSLLDQIVQKGMQALGTPDELAGEAVRTAVQGLPFRLPTLAQGYDVENKYATTNQKPSSFLGELTGTMSGIAQAGRAAIKGQPIGQAFQREVFRPKTQPADLPGQIAVAFGLPNVSNAPLNAALEIGKASSTDLGKLASNISSIGTKVDPQNYATIFKNPEGVIPGALKKASDNFGKALVNSGIDQSKVTAERLASLKNSEPYAFDAFKELQDKGTLAPEKALYARQAVDKIYPTPNAKNSSYRNLLDGMRNSFNEVLNNSSPEIQKASKEYAIAKAGSKFQSILPQTQAGKPAFFHGAAMEEIVRRGLLSGDPLNALKALPMVPAIAGYTTAGLGLASKPISYLMNNPVIKSALLSALAKERINQNQDNQ